MPGHLAIESVEVATVDINLPNTIGQFGPDYPIFRVMLDFKLLPYRKHDGPPLPVTFLHLRATLLIGKIRFAECYSTPNLHSDRLEYPAQQLIALEFPLDAFRIRRMDEQRKGDFSGTLHLEPLFALHGNAGSITRFVKVESYDMRLDIPQSHWTGRVLLELGYHRIGLVELPFPSTLIEGFQIGANELRRAVGHFIDGKPPEAVAACRMAIEAAISKKPTEKTDDRNRFTARVDRLIEQHLMNISKAKRDHFRTTVTSLWALASIPHHPGTENYFDREDAELIIRETAAFLAYAGRVLN